MSVYQVYLECAASGCMAHILSLPGCTAFGKSEKPALQNLKISARRHLHWLKSHGWKGKIPAEFQFKIAERKKGTSPWISSSAAALFLPDLIPPSKFEINEHLRLLKWSRSDLLKLVDPLNEEVKGFRLPNRWSIRHNLNHIANAEWWYLSRIKDWKELRAVPERIPPEKTIQRMQKVRQIAYRILPRLTEERYHQIFIPQKYCNPKLKEPWTARKVLRRFIEHEREHYYNILQMLGEMKKRQ